MRKIKINYECTGTQDTESEIIEVPDDMSDGEIAKEALQVVIEEIGLSFWHEEVSETDEEEKAK